MNQLNYGGKKENQLYLKPQIDMKTPLTAECLKGPGCPPGVDLRECAKWPNNCPLVHVHGSDIILESPQQKLFKDTQDDPE